MIPGKQYKPEDYLEIAWRRRWVVVLPFVVIALGAIVYAQLLPDRYKSEALVVVMAPQVPVNYVRPVEVGTLQERLDAMRAQILSRSRLERIVQEFDLYPEERQTMLMDQVVERMRRDISISVPRPANRKADPGSFTVSFHYHNPRVAQQVANRVASLFVAENTQARSLSAEQTNQFLQRELDQALQRLRDQESRIEQFRKANIGRLPSEVQSNLTMIQTTRQELQQLADANSRDRERQIAIERTLSELVAAPSSAPVSVAAVNGGEAPATATQALAVARATLDRMQLRYKDDHPDVREMRRRIGELEARVDAEALQQPLGGEGATAGLTPAEVVRRKQLADLRAEFDQLDRTIAGRRERANRLEAMAGDYKNRVELAPALESELAQLMRGYETLKETHDSLLRRSQDAQIAVNLEERQITQQFRIIDNARVPDAPSSPDRLRISGLGALAGLVLGLAFAGLLEYRDTSLRTEDDVLIALSLPVVASVPTMLTASERQNARRRRVLLAGSAAVLTLVGSAAAIAWKLRLFDNWIR